MQTGIFSLFQGNQFLFYLTSQPLPVHQTDPILAR